MLAKLLESKKRDVNKPDGGGHTAVCRAVQKLRLHCVELLLDHASTDLTLKDQVGKRTALDWTAEHIMHYEENSAAINSIASLLLNDKRTPKVSSRTVTLAIEQSELQLLDLFANAGLDYAYTDVHGRTFLHLAAVVGDCSVVQLIHHHASGQPAFNLDQPDKYGASVLHLSCREVSKASLDTITFLLKAGVDPLLPDHQGFTAAWRARSRSVELWSSDVKAIFRPHIDQVSLDADETIALEVSSLIRVGDLASLKAHLNTSSNPLSSETDQYTLCTILHLTLETLMPDNSKEEILTLLLPRSKHCINATTRYGRTCAHLAVLQSSPPCLKSIVEDGGVDMDIEDQWDMTAFDLAQGRERYELCIYLASKGARLPPLTNIRPEMLHAAVGCGELGVVKQLVSIGVNTYYRDPTNGLTTLQRAVELWEGAAQHVNDKLIRDKLFVSEDTFRKAKYGAPDVVRREVIVRFLQQAQKGAVKPPGQQRASQDLSTLIADVKALEPEQALEELELSLETKGLDPLPSYEDATQSRPKKPEKKPLPSAGRPRAHHGNGMDAYRAGIGNPFDVGLGVVIVVMSICVRVVAVVWLIVIRQEQSVRHDWSEARLATSD
ncbi:hypothetical protein LTR36_003665 [Oleoguttula mirabilis]|uniref:Ankyrin n=1 Tax=Oleoguttula mirabilis TaxID=1507867 RepID=A0AAV9JJM9_9PEZI|nr:hypothetical protein LTR36_003665 [Oleoguttula mirabilis]